MKKSQVRINAVESIETPMEMSYRESYAWQLGWEEGYRTAKEEENDN